MAVDLVERGRHWASRSNPKNVQKKMRRSVYASFLLLSYLVAVSGLETIATVNRPVAGWLERNFGFCTAVCAYCRIHLARSTAVSAGVALLLAVLTAGEAASRLIGEAFL